MRVSRGARMLLTFTLLAAMLVPFTGGPLGDVAYAAPASEVEANNTKETANTIGVGAQNYMQARMGNATDVDFFTFTAVQSVDYVVETFNVGNAIGGGGLTLDIFDANGNKLDTPTNSTRGVGNASVSATFNATTGGPIFIAVEHNQSNGIAPYNIRVVPHFAQPEASWDAEEEPNNWSANAFQITPGRTNAVASSIEQRIAGYITYAPDVDWYRFEATAGQSYAIETFNVAQAVSPNNTWMQVEVYDRDFSRIDTAADNTRGVGNISGSANINATKGGTIYVQVYPYFYDAGSGPYSIRVLPQFDQPTASWDGDEEPNNWSTTAFKIEVGRLNVVESTIERRDEANVTYAPDVDWYRFEALPGQDYVVESFNVAKAVSPNTTPLQMEVFDRDFSQLDTNANESRGVGNTSTSVGFKATKGGTIYIHVYPYYYDAGSGPYSLRVLPRYDQASASWDAALEPNNRSSTAFPLDVSLCRLTTIVERNSAYLTFSGDEDWYVFSLNSGEQYTLALSDVAGGLGDYGLHLVLYDRENSKIKEITTSTSGAKTEISFKPDYTGVFYALVFGSRDDRSGSYRVRVAPTFSEGCEGEPPPRATAEGSVSSGTNPDTGEITIRGSRGGSNVVRITALANCGVGVVAQNVTLKIGSKIFTTSGEGGNRFGLSLTVPSDLPEGAGPFEMSLSFTCNGQIVVIILGIFVLIDPSGQVTDVNTGAPITGASVRLYRVPNALPDKPGQQGQCRTLDTRGAGGWGALPAAALNAGVAYDPLLDVSNDTLQALPQINPQVTGSDGRYAWNVVEGCWYVVVRANGYQTRISPLVGVPPAVTDLDLTLTPAKPTVYLPLIVKR